MNEMMIQEAVLNSIDTVDDSVLFAEFDVLMSMYKVYEKSLLIQEQAGLIFDGENVIQEAEDATSDSGDTKTGVGKKLKGGFSKYVVGNTEKGNESGIVGMVLKFLRWIKDGLKSIGKKLAGIFKKKKKYITDYEAAEILENGGEIEFKNAEVAAYYNLPVKPTVADIRGRKHHLASGTKYMAGIKTPAQTKTKSRGGEDEPETKQSESKVLMIEMKDIVVKYNLGIHVGEFKRGYEFFKKSIEEFNKAVTSNNDPSFKGHLADADKNKSEAMKHWSNSMRGKTGKSLIELQEIEMELSGITSWMNETMKALDDVEKTIKVANGVNFDTRSVLVTFIQKESRVLATGMRCATTIYEEISGIKTSANRSNPDTSKTGPNPDMPSI